MAADTRPDTAEPGARRVSRTVVGGVSALLIVGALALGVLIVRDFNRSLEPELARRAALIGQTVGDDTERALEVGIPIGELVGVSEYFQSFLDEFGELTYLAIRDADGRVVYASEAAPPAAMDVTTIAAPASAAGPRRLGDSLVFSTPVVVSDTVVGGVDVGVDAFFIRSKLQDLTLDVGVILLVALVAAFEVTLALSQRIVGRARAGRRWRASELTGTAGDIRLVLFVFVVAEEMNKSFLPLFIQSAEQIPGIEPAVAIGLPIMAYLLTLAIASPFAGRLVGAFGQRGVFLIGLTAAGLSHLGMVFADSVIEIMALRALTGVGYALATIACLEYLLDLASGRNRARTIGVFVAVVIGGTFAGTAIGGILADRLGYRAVFVISFVLVIVAGVIALRMMRPGAGRSSSQSASFTMPDVIAVLKRPSLLLLLAGVTLLITHNVHYIGETVAAALYLFSGAIFPIEALPAWLRWIGYINPIAYWLELIRRSLLGPATQAFPTFNAFTTPELFAILIGMTLIYGVMSVLVFKWCDHNARERGMIDRVTNW